MGCFQDRIVRMMGPPRSPEPLLPVASEGLTGFMRSRLHDVPFLAEKSRQGVSMNYDNLDLGLNDFNLQARGCRHPGMAFLSLDDSAPSCLG